LHSTLIRLVAKAAAAAFTGIIVLLVGAGVILSRGPVSVAPLAPYLEEVLEDPSWGFRVRFADAVLTWEGWRRKLDIRVVGAQFLDRGGAELISVPQMAVVLDGKALLRGHLRATALELIGPRLRLLRRADGRIVIAGENGGRGISFDPSESTALRQADGGSPFGDLDKFSVLGADLAFQDEASGLALTVPAADLHLVSEAGGVNLRLATRLRTGGTEAAFGIGAFYRDEATPMVVAVNFAEVNVAALAQAVPLPALAELRRIRLVADGHLDFTLTADGTVGDLTFEISTGAGEVELPEIYDQPMPVASVSAKGRAVAALRHVLLERLTLDLGEGLRAEASGEIDLRGVDLAVRGKGRFLELPTVRLRDYWPEKLGVKARGWVMRNIRGGVVREGRFTVDLRPGDLDRAPARADLASLDWTFEGVGASYLGELPPIQQASGSGHVDARRFSLQVDRALAGGLEVSEGSLDVPDLSLSPPVLDIEFVASGRLPDALALLDAQPLGFAAELGLRPTAVAGDSATRARLRIPLHENLGFAEVGFSAAANISGLAIADILGQYRLAAGAVALDVDPAALRLQGLVTINEVPLRLDWRRNFQTAATAPRGQLVLHGTIDDDQRRALGLTAPVPVVGAVTVGLSVDAYADGSRRGSAKLDLTSAQLDLAGYPWRKQPFQPAELGLTFHTGADGATLVDHFQFTGGDLQARGSAQLDATPRLLALRLDEFNHGATRLAADLRPLADGGYQVSLAGQSLDLRQFLSRWLTAEPDRNEPALDLTLAIDRVLLTDEVTIAGLRGAGRRRHGVWSAADMQGSVAEGLPVRYHVAPAKGGRRVSILTGDAGAMARALDIYANARGGTMVLNLRIPEAGKGEQAIVGHLRADDFRVVGAPVLARLLTLGSLTGFGDLLRGQGISFTRLNVPFTMHRDKVVLKNARAAGPALALITNGEYGRADRSLRFRGTIVPSYTLNSVLGNIPILGNLLVGRRGEGVFAFTYAVEGSIDQPKVSVNLLSALAPGFLRRIVEGLEQPAVDQVPTELGKQAEEERQR
jgi:hypothetical protein